MAGTMSEAKSNELFVRSIPLNITNDQLSDYFSDFAPVKHAVIVMDKETGTSKGFGFVAFATPEDAQQARQQASDKPLEGRQLQIDVAKVRHRKEKADQVEDNEAQQDKDKRRPRLLIRNCPWSLRDPKELIKIFSRFGKVVDAYIPRGPNDRMSGFAFVTMRRKKHAKTAIEQSSSLKIHDREVSVSLALEKSKWLKTGKPAEVELESDSESESDTDSIDKNDLTEVNSVDQSDEISEDDMSKELDDPEPENDDEFENGMKGSTEESEVQLEQKDSVFSDNELNSKLSSANYERRSNDKNTIFVRNVPYDATSESLKSHFECNFGPIVYALPVIDREKNYAKGTAFVAFRYHKDLEDCIASAPNISTSSLLVPDDADPRYVYEGRVLNVARAVQRDTAEQLSSQSSIIRLEQLGKGPKIQDKRRIFLLNEGRINSSSKLAETISKSEMEIREKSYQLRKQQLSKNPSLHLSMTRLAIRNLPRSMDEKALKALGRKAVVSFAKEVKEQRRQPLSKEEIMRSIHYQNTLSDSANSRKHGVVKQAKIIQELKGSGKAGRSRGYGFLEMKNHKSALMALRWLNAHQVTKEEIAAGDETVSEAEPKRRLVVEFAIENAQVLKRQRERQFRAQEKSQRRKAEKAEAEHQENLDKEKDEEQSSKRKSNSIIGRKRKFKRMKTN